MLLLQLSSAQGPAECELAVSKALRLLYREAEAQGVRTSLVEQVPGQTRDTHKSALISLDGEQAARLAERWTGTLLWTCKSPCRPGHKRKNWYFAGQLFKAPQDSMDGEIRFEAMRASGPGGQHVNTTDSAVRATHLATGISVKVQSERSQHDNKRVARLLILQRLADRQQQSEEALRLQRRDAHHRVERGNPVRSFNGNAFIAQDCPPGHGSRPSRRLPAPEVGELHLRKQGTARKKSSTRSPTGPPPTTRTVDGNDQDN